jgi:hypothetical protein
VTKPPDPDCISFPTRGGAVRQVVDQFVLGRARGCAYDPPFWNTPIFCVGLAVIAGIAAWDTSHHVLGAATVLVIALVVLTKIAGWLDPNAYHGTCAICGLCSLHVGVPGGRTRAQSVETLRMNGWSVSHDDRREHCPEHANVPFLRIVARRLPWVR